jgi:chloramphenicol 3-O phosphotransferase
MSNLPGSVLPALILLNGVSSAGKSSIARELQRRLPGPYLHVALDNFIAMLPWGKKDDTVFMNLVDGFQRSVFALIDAGNIVIVDHVMYDDRWKAQMAAGLSRTSSLLVGVLCPLEELERRERLRNVGRQGFARAQFDLVHRNMCYDATVDSAVTSAAECAGVILDAISQPLHAAEMWRKMFE